MNSQKTPSKLFIQRLIRAKGKMVAITFGAAVILFLALTYWEINLKRDFAQNQHLVELTQFQLGWEDIELIPGETSIITASFIGNPESPYVDIRVVSHHNFLSFTRTKSQTQSFELDWSGNEVEIAFELDVSDKVPNDSETASLEFIVTADGYTRSYHSVHAINQK